jgi:hypothetical protein
MITPSVLASAFLIGRYLIDSLRKSPGRVRT